MVGALRTSTSCQVYTDQLETFFPTVLWYKWPHGQELLLLITEALVTLLQTYRMLSIVQSKGLGIWTFLRNS